MSDDATRAVLARYETRMMTVSNCNPAQLYVSHDVNAMAARIAELERVVESVEWYCALSNTSESCPSCGAMKHWGHEEGCELAAAMHAEATHD